MTLIRNPHADVRLAYEDGVIRSVSVRAPVKGRGLRTTRIVRPTESEVFGLLLLSAIRDDWPGPANDLSGPAKARLAEIGFLVPENEVSTPVRFFCDIDDPPSDLVPRRALCSRTDPYVDDRLVNQTLRQLGEAGPPPEMRGRKRLANPFRTDRSWLWLQEAFLSAPSVYSVRPETKTIFDRLLPGEPPPSLPDEQYRHLLQAGVLGSSAETTRQFSTRASQLANARRHLLESRYVVLPHVIRPFQLAAVRRYYRDLIAEGFLQLGDEEWPDCYFSSLEPLAHCFHQQFTDLVSEIAGERVKPTFLFFRRYSPGSELPPHEDRRQCEYSLSILLDHSPEPDDISPWPLYLQPPGAAAGTPVAQGIGDAILYRGCELTHYRHPLGAGNEASLWFFFYVSESFTGSLD